MTSILVPPTLSDPHDEMRSKMDKEIAELEAKLLELKLARNNLVPVARLHPEILQEIFFFAHDTGTDKGKTALFISWVCHRWRELAHHMSALWSYIELRHPQWVETALARAKDRELEFRIELITSGSFVEPIPTRSISLCLANLYRIRALKLATSPGSTLSVLNGQEWITPAPILGLLDLRGFYLPPRLFSGIYPALQSMELNQCQVDWETLLLPSGLTKLTIMTPIERPTFMQVLRTLQTAGKSLECLILQNVFIYTYGPGPVTDKLSLQSLQFLKLDEEYSSEITRFLSYISFPQHTTIEVSVLNGGGAELAMLPALVAARTMEKWPIKRLEISANYPFLIIRIVEGWSKVEDHETFPGDNHETHVLFTLGYDADEPIDAISFITLLPIHPIESVLVHHHEDEMDIVQYIGNLDTVKELRVDLHSVGTFLNIFDAQVNYLLEEVGTTEATSDPLKTSSIHNILSFRNLRVLHIHGTKEKVSFEGDGVPPLLEWLKWRMLAGISLETLHLSNLTIPSSFQMDIFSQFVGEVRADILTENGPGASS